MSQPTPQLSLQATGEEGWSRNFNSARNFCTRILLPRSFLNILSEEEVNNTEIVHLVVEVESLQTSTEQPYKKRDVTTGFNDLRHAPINDKLPSTLGEPPGFEKDQQSSDGLALPKERHVPVVQSPPTESACIFHSIVSSCIHLPSVMQPYLRNVHMDTQTRPSMKPQIVKLKGADSNHCKVLPQYLSPKPILAW